MTSNATTPSAGAAAETAPRPRRYRSTTRRLLTTELRLIARDPLTLTFVLVFPIVTMLIIGGSFGTEPDEVFPVNPSHWYVASYFSVVIGATGLIMLPVHIASYRERGVLRRFAASGFPRWSFALAQLAIGLSAIAIAGLLLLAVAAPVYGVPNVESPVRVLAGIAGSVVTVVVVPTATAPLVSLVGADLGIDSRLPPCHAARGERLVVARALKVRVVGVGTGRGNRHCQREACQQAR